MASISEVVARDICIGCGACAIATNGAIPIRYTDEGMFVASLEAATTQDLEIGSSVCPFADESVNEDVLAAASFANLPSDGQLGRYDGLYAGRITDQDELIDSSSGGLTTWMLSELLRTSKVDGVIHVGSADDRLFEYSISYQIDELKSRRKSRYHSVGMADVLSKIENDGRRYAIVGVPCMITAAKLLTREKPSLRTQLAVFVGIVCGHMKSAAYAEAFAWQLGVRPDNIDTVDFRIKEPGKLSRQYSFGAKGDDGQWRKASTASLVGGSWGHSVFQLNACNYCDDVFAESADIVFGDAWLPRYEAEWRGTNVVLTRSKELCDLLLAGQQAGTIELDVLSVADVARTQLGNFRHRRDGLAIRLADDREAGRWAPKKRVAPDAGQAPSDRVEIIRLRRDLAQASHGAFREAKNRGDLSYYLHQVQPFIDRLNAVGRVPFGQRLRLKAQREFWLLVKRGRRSKGAAGAVRVGHGAATASTQDQDH